MTALAAGEINRLDGLPDLVVGVAGPDGPAALVFEGPDGALEAEPEVLPMPGAVSALARGPVTGSGLMDLVVAAWQELVIVHGRDRQLDLDQTRTEAPKPQIDRQAVPFTLDALALGSFTGGPRPDIAALDGHGTVHLTTRADGDQAWQSTAVFSLPEGTARSARRGGPQLVTAKVSSLPTDDLVVLDAGTRQLHVLMAAPDASPSAARGADPGAAEPDAATSQARAHSPLSLAISLATTAAPVAVLPMRLNRDALSDLVILQAGQPAPSVALTEPVNVFVVTNTADSGFGSLRQAILDANASPGADAIDFEIPSPGIETLSQLPRITEAVTIDGTTQIDFMPFIFANNRAIDGLVLGGGGSVVRGLVTLLFGLNDIHVASRGNVVEGNLIGILADGGVAFFPGRAGVRLGSAASNTIGGTAPAARNMISGKSYGIIVAGGAAAGNRILGNFIGGPGFQGHRNHGILVSNAPNTVIGGTAASARNVISGNFVHGVAITGGFATGNLVQGNFIGTNLGGTGVLGNGNHGVLVTNAPNTVIGGTAASARNVISGNGGPGLRILGSAATGAQVLGNFIGTNAAGTSALGNAQSGVVVDGAPGTIVGGTAVGARNVISANNQHGIHLRGVDTSGSQVLGNFIGTTAAGTSPLGNALAGIFVDGAPRAQIGGTTAGAGNVISGNPQSGVRVIGSAAAGAVVQGNRIGTNAAGTAKLANGGDGVLIRDAPGAAIGGTTPAARNVISGNAGSGISLEDAGTTGTVVQGNLIGTNAAGTAALGNQADGVTIIAPGTTIGGVVAGARNVIAGNGASGVSIGAAAPGTRVQGNFIGTDVTGTLDLGNAQQGVDVVNQIGATIGGTTSLARNVISGNNLNGVRLAGATTTGALVQGNFIGTTATGTAPRPNAGHGILINFSASGNRVGGTAAGAGNTIAFNGADGVFVESGTGNAVSANAIVSNVGLGIDLGPNGVTPNDAGDGDAGANTLQNFPVVTAARSSSTATTITGTLASTPSTTFRLEFFRSVACDPSGNGEGQVFLGARSVTTASNGSAAFTHVVTPAVPVNQRITATATPTTGAGINSTSEHSACRTVTAAAAP